jgi:hypothetical protein
VTPRTEEPRLGVNEELRSDPPADTPKRFQLRRVLKGKTRALGTISFVQTARP